MYMIENRVRKTIEKYNLLKKDDKIAVALSGGKDSTSVLYILHKLGYNVSGLMIDLKLGKWSEMHKKNMKKFCKELGVHLEVVDLREELGAGICFIKQAVKERKNLTGCSVCGIIKKYILNKWAKKLNADKIATGHNLDDECQNVLMNFLKGNILLGIGSSPITESCRNFVQRIKPLFFIPENEIREYAKKMKFDISYEKCPCAFGTYRVEMRNWMSFLTDKEKMRIVSEFQKIIPELRREHRSEIKECRICGEPSRKEVCNACKVLECLKES